MLWTLKCHSQLKRGTKNFGTIFPFSRGNSTGKRGFISAYSIIHLCFFAKDNCLLWCLKDHLLQHFTFIEHLCHFPTQRINTLWPGSCTCSHTEIFFFLQRNFHVDHNTTSSQTHCVSFNNPLPLQDNWFWMVLHLHNLCKKHQQVRSGKEGRFN